MALDGGDLVPSCGREAHAKQPDAGVEIKDRSGRARGDDRRNQLIQEEAVTLEERSNVPAQPDRCGRKEIGSGHMGRTHRRKCDPI